LIEEIGKQLRVRELVKIKFLRSFTDLYDIRETSAEIARETKSCVVQKIGNTLVLYRGKKRGKEDQDSP
jgi:RNA-binding protein YhbY